MKNAKEVLKMFDITNYLKKLQRLRQAAIATNLHCILCIALYSLHSTATLPLHRKFQFHLALLGTSLFNLCDFLLYIYKLGYICHSMEAVCMSSTELSGHSKWRFSLFSLSSSAWVTFSPAGVVLGFWEFGNLPPFFCF